jgi:hypothetical protein
MPEPHGDPQSHRAVKRSIDSIGLCDLAAAGLLMAASRRHGRAMTEPGKIDGVFFGTRPPKPKGSGGKCAVWRFIRQTGHDKPRYPNFGSLPKFWVATQTKLRNGHIVITRDHERYPKKITKMSWGVARVATVAKNNEK